MKYSLRHDYVLCRIQDKPITDGIAYPQNSLEGKEYIVVEVGWGVEGLETGDKVMVVGKDNESYAFVPGSNKLFVTDSKFIPYSYEEEE